MENLDEAVSVLSYYNAKIRKSRPIRIKWRGRVYGELRDISVPLTLTVKGDTVIAYNVMTKSMQLVLHFNTRTLQWLLKSANELDISPPTTGC